MTITAAADGSSLGNPGPTGWAWYIDADRWAAGGFPRGTNNIGELTAVAELLDATAHADEPLRILCDSKYVIDSCTKWMRGWKRNGWKKKDGKPVLNVELMQRLDAALAGRDVTFEWVKGHAGHTENEAADDRARAVATAYAGGGAPSAALLGPGFGAGGSGRSGRSGGSGGSGGSGDAAGSADRDGAATGAGTATATATPLASPPAERIRSGETTLWGDFDDDIDDALDGELDADATGVVALERRLVSGAVRGSRAQLEELLHDAFTYVGADGRTASREQLISALVGGAGAAPRHVGPVVAEPVGPGVQLVRSTEEVDGRHTAHASLWVFEPTGPGDGQWRLRFHQLTPLEGTVPPAEA